MRLSRVLVFLLVLVGSFLLVSCSSPISDTSGQSGLSISIANNTQSRTLAPSLDMDAAAYSISGSGPDGANFTASSTGESVSKTGLAFGTWTVVVNATNAEGTLIATGSASALVSTGVTTAVAVTVTPISGTGSLSLDVSWPVSQVQTPLISASLTPALGAVQNLAFTISGATARYSNPAVGNGYYTLGFTLTDNNIAVAGAVEVVRIISGQATSGTYNFSQVNAPGGNLQMNIVANMQNPLAVVIAGATATLDQGSIQTLTASVSNATTNIVYLWYVNGVSAGTGASFSFGSGTTIGYHYRIDVTAFSADGTQAGSASTNVRITAPNPTVARGTFLAGGDYHSLALKTDGSLWAYGANYFGQLGDGTTVEHSTPVQVMTNVASVAAGNGHSLVLQTNGSLWTFGNNTQGQLGDGTTINRSLPTQVMTGVASIAAGSSHSFAAKSDGTLWAFGKNENGQLGDGTTIDRTVPVQVMTNVAAVSAGDGHSLVLKTDGTLWAFGKNLYGQLGDGTNIDRSTPVQVMTGVASIDAGNVFSLAIKSDGTLWAFGYNAEGGVLGDGTSIDRNTPVQVMSGVASVTAGGCHAFALKTDATLWAFGTNYYGELGDGTNTGRNVPVQVMSGVSAAVMGFMHSLILKTDGTLWATGNNYHGQLGDGTTVNRSTPVQVMGGL